MLISSRRRHTRYWSDWSSDVCSSDLRRLGQLVVDRLRLGLAAGRALGHVGLQAGHHDVGEAQVVAADGEDDHPHVLRAGDRKSVVWGKSVDLGGLCLIR